MVINKYTKQTFKFIEIAIVVLLIVTVLLTSKEIAVTLWHDFQNQLLIDHYKLILSEILLLAIGVEMAILIIKKNAYFVIDILILAIARKLITYENSIDLLISIVCVILLLAAKVYHNRYVYCKTEHEDI
ncbi:hypothetical protein BHU72_08830 [Desulfuribacillus stibiiarsenatis]|uniref:Protein PsiE n=1 Tax=Desulfuribacillus stibiiarsenatis TaxID=1390249 RepID=A0A1E5L3D7_9FIRM|nr:hypothetical protein [Desulfuribacillus stibiiarsenatis]OEH84591.1 hypothetical protein BHU72_08830 [Desulfuribacillus stibiiarsenatis]